MKTLLNMKTFLASLLLIFSFQALAQTQSGQLSGTVKDQKQNPLPYSNVVIYNLADSSMVTGTVTDEAGKFSLKLKLEQQFYVKISAVGFNNYFSKSFQLTAAAPELMLEQINLQEDVQVMDAVEVKALRPQVVMEADKMVVSVEGTAMAAGTTAYEVLEKSPGVFLDQDGNIQLNGKAGVLIMIDGRRTYLSATDLQNMLQGMSADNIKNIEIINNPSAKYDAEGNSGIINITLKKNTMVGMNGSVNAGYRYNEMQNYNAGVQLNYKKDKWNSFLNADFSQRGRLRDARFYREVEQTSGVRTIFDQDAKEYNARMIPSLRAGTDYDINDKHSIGVMVNFYGQDVYHDFNFISELNQDGEMFDIQSENDMNYRFLNAQGNLHYTYKLDTNGTKLTTDFNYIQLVNEGSFSFVNRYFFNEETSPSLVERLETNNPFSYDIYSAQVDFEKNLFPKVKMEVGVKGSSVVSDNNLEFYEIEESGKNLDETRSNHFVYTENIFAAYTSFSGSINERITYKAGLRAEQTYSEGELLTTNEINKRDYLDYFPSFFLQHKVSDAYQVNYNYSRRIDRPQYSDLNPFILYLDPYTWAQGNPNLQPQYTHSLSVTQTFMGKYNLVLNYGLTKDFIAEIPLQNPEDGTTVFKESNVDDQVSYSATAVVPLQPFKWWTVNANFTAFYQEFSTIINNENVIKEATTGMAQIGNTFMLPKDFKLELNGDYRSNTVWGLYSIDAQWGIDVAVKKSFMDKKLEASLSFSDIFRTRRFEGSASFQGNVNEISQYFGQQSVGVSLRYRFSKGEEFKSNQRNTNLEELNRAGG